MSNAAFDDRILLIAYSPANLLMGMSAILELYPRTPVDLFLLDLSADSTVAKKQMASAYQEIVEVQTIDWEGVASFESIPSWLVFPFFPHSLASLLYSRLLSNRLQSFFPKRTYKTIFYPHSAIGNFIDCVKTASPGANVVCCGDSFGLFVDKRTHLRLVGVTHHGHPFLTEHTPSLAVGALPVDQFGGFAGRVPLHVVPREHLLRLIRQAREGFPELEPYLQSITEKYVSRPLGLLMTENYAEGGFLSFEKELAMYAEMVRIHVPAGAVIIHKPHPGETLQRFEQLVSLLPEYELVALDDRYSFLPVEMMEELVLACGYCFCMGYPVLSLAYLYGKKVHDPAFEDSDFIARWVEPKFQPLFANAVQTYWEPFKALNSWDHTGFLWFPKNG